MNCLNTLIVIVLVCIQQISCLYHADCRPTSVTVCTQHVTQLHRASFHLPKTEAII